jgi:D-sedoheptulose 7-phosphate isomerase
MKNLIKKNIEDHMNVLSESSVYITDQVSKISKVLLDCIDSGNKILLFGNGGSAADAQHISAELTGRFVKERRALAAIALTTDTSALTAIGNDYGFDKIFQRQVEALAVKGDVLIGISTSGNSTNVINALETGKSKHCINISFTGNTGGKILELSNYNININSNITARIQEMHILIGHLLCTCIDEKFI